MITFKKDINELICFKDVDGVQDLVHTVVWTLIATDEDTGDSEAFGVRTEVPNLSTSEFTPFEDLGEQTVQGWIDSYTPIQRLDAAQQYLINSINERKTHISRIPPWNNYVIGA